MKFNIKDLKGDWEKFWAFKFSLLGASMLGSYYPKMMGDQMGKCFKNVILISKKGHTSCYIVQKERKVYGEYQINKYVKDGNISEFCKFMKEKTDNLFSLLKNLKQKQITNQEFKNFIDTIREYTGFYAVPRQVIDFIDPSMVRKIFEDLKELRLYVEPAFGLIEEVIQKFAKQISSDPGLVSCLIIKELEEYLKTGKLPEERILKKRFNECAVVFNKSKYFCTTDAKIISELDQIHIKKSEEEVKGNVAFKGKARGIARIVFDPFNANNFNKGEVLITGMTRPDFLPLMEKASAIVTDIGGLLCHAAIVARELGKPCIIGTVKASKTFKDGDYVEVDADKGVIKRITEEKNARDN
jgi:phosphohistidine swiveling domain-containing protein